MIKAQSNIIKITPKNNLNVLLVFLTNLLVEKVLPNFSKIKTTGTETSTKTAQPSKSIGLCGYIAIRINIEQIIEANNKKSSLCFISQDVLFFYSNISLLEFYPTTALTTFPIELLIVCPHGPVGIALTIEPRSIPK